MIEHNYLTNYIHSMVQYIHSPLQDINYETRNLSEEKTIQRARFLGQSNRSRIKLIYLVNFHNFILNKNICTEFNKN